MHVLQLVRSEFTVDPDRIFLWGHSMGGAGTYHLAAKHPDIWGRETMFKVFAFFSALRKSHRPPAD
jgi:S-formylglutathione hydrolase FrmB